MKIKTRYLRIIEKWLREKTASEAAVNITNTEETIEYHISYESNGYHIRFNKIIYLENICYYFKIYETGYDEDDIAFYCEIFDLDKQLIEIKKLIIKIMEEKIRKHENEKEISKDNIG